MSVSTGLCAHFRENFNSQVLLKDLPEDPKSYMCLGNENRIIFAQARITSEYHSSLLVYCIKRASIQKEVCDKAFWKYWS